MKELYLSSWVLEGKDAKGSLLIWFSYARRRGAPALPQSLQRVMLGMRPLPLPLSFSPQDLYLLIMKDESLYQDLREDTLRLHQLVETVELK